MIHSLWIGPKARGRANDLTSVCVVVCYYAIKTVKTTSGTVSISSCVTFITLVAAVWDLK